MIDFTLGLRVPYHFMRLTTEVKLYLKLLQSFLTNFKGRTFFLEVTWSSSDKRQLYTDAAGALGFVAVFGSKWCYGKWPDNWLHRNISFFGILPNCAKLTPWGARDAETLYSFFSLTMRPLSMLSISSHGKIRP